MIIHRCDICKKNVAHLDTMVLYRNSFDYCMYCKKEAEDIKEKFKREYDYEYSILDSRIKSKERNFIKQIEEMHSSEFIIKNNRRDK